MVDPFIFEDKLKGIEALVPDCTKYIHFRGRVIAIRKCLDGLWRSMDGTIWGFTEDTAVVDPVSRCGVGIFSLAAEHELTSGCQPHDYAYSSPAYQLFHTRKEADEMLLNNINLIGKSKWYSVFAKPFYYFSRWFGGKYWENNKTR